MFQPRIYKYPALRYVNTLFNVLVEAVFLIIVTITLYTVLLYFVKAMWYLFNSTQVGQAYAEQFSYNYRMTQDVFNRDIADLTMAMVITAFTVCLLVSAVCQIFHISRYFYASRSFFWRISVWGLPLTYAVAYVSVLTNKLNDLDVSFTVALIPTLCVFMGCFKYSGKLLPELEDVIKRIKF